MRAAEINIRDPFVLTYEGKYYMYGTRGDECWTPEAYGLDVYVSENLTDWSRPREIFSRTPGFLYTKNFWAPEVHEYKGRFYMFVSFKRDSICRGTAILSADRPDDVFTLHSDGIITPETWECLDGTLYLSGEGVPYMAFSHEWVQTTDGEICAMRLSEDLKTAAGEPFLLFKASEAPWVKPHSGAYVTDGPFMHRFPDGELGMIWSSFGDNGYAVGIARSDNGDITGNWTQDKAPLPLRDGGHGMIFRTLDNRTMLVLHSPNKKLAERPVFLELDGTDLNVPFKF